MNWNNSENSSYLQAVIKFITQLPDYREILHADLLQIFMKYDPYKIIHAMNK